MAERRDSGNTIVGWLGTEVFSQDEQEAEYEDATMGNNKADEAGDGDEQPPVPPSRPLLKDKLREKTREAKAAHKDGVAASTSPKRNRKKKKKKGRGNNK